LRILTSIYWEGFCMMFYAKGMPAECFIPGCGQIKGQIALVSMIVVLSPWRGDMDIEIE
jgi:hypothetical protein